METANIVAVTLIAAVILTRLVLSWKFRREQRAKSIAVSTAQMLLVGAAVLAHNFFGDKHSWLILASSLLLIICLWLIPLSNSSR